MQLPLTHAELDQIRCKSNWRGAWCVFCQWGITVAIFVTAAVFPNPITIIVGTVLLGGRQLGFFVLTHECGHTTLFSSPSINRFVETWLLSPLDLTNGKSYMREHLEHHRSAGQSEDPDLANYGDYPISRARLQRKLLRDITGQTGWRNWSLKLTALFHLQDQTTEDQGALLRGVAVNLGILVSMSLAGAPWLYLMWMVALVFVQPVVVRIRQIAEHAAVPDLTSLDPRQNTRTLYAHPLVRLIFCPHQVNFHIEHHLLASIPIYRLGTMHKKLRAHGYYGGLTFERGYINMLRWVTTPTAQG